MIILRSAMIEDATSLWHVRTMAIAKMRSTYYSPQELLAWSQSPIPDSFGTILVNLGAVVAEKAKKIVGFGFIDANAKMLKGIFVDPEHEGKGVGKLLMQNLEHQAVANGVDELSISSSMNAVDFYESVGYVSGRVTIINHPSGCALACTKMKKRLTEL